MEFVLVHDKLTKNSNIQIYNQLLRNTKINEVPKHNQLNMIGIKEKLHENRESNLLRS